MGLNHNNFGVTALRRYFGEQFWEIIAGNHFGKQFCGINSEFFFGEQE